MTIKQMLKKGIVVLVLVAAVLLSAACGGATISAPTDEPNPLAPSMGPLLSYYVAQHNVIGYSTVADAWMGYSVALGDFNGDGRLDIATGAPRRESGHVMIRQSIGTGYLIAGLSEYNLGVGATGADDFGWSLAVGNFNGDAYDDLAIGAPRRDLDGQENAGEAFVLYGSNMGLTFAGFTRISQGQDGAREPGDLLGWSLVAGDLNGDGYADLAIGAPGEDYDGQTDAGAVLIRWGSGSGLNRAYTPTLLTHPEPQAGSQFGYALAAGHFQSALLVNGHALYDLAVSSPFRDETEYSVTQRADLVYRDAGEVMFFWGVRARRYGLETGSRLTDRITDEPHFGRSLAAGHFNGGGLHQLAIGASHHLDRRGYVAIVEPARSKVLYRLYQDPDGLTDDGLWVLGLDEPGDEFGYALAAGDLNGDDLDDLAIGTPYENWHGTDTGLVYIRFGSNAGLTTNEAYFLSQGNGVGSRERDDRFGMALAAGDLDGNGSADLAIGSPDEDIVRNGQSFANAGALFVALSRAPVFGPFEGTWMGTINGDRSSSASIRVRLQDRDNVVRGTAEILNPGIIIDVNEICAPGNSDDESPSGYQSMPIDGATSAASPRSLSVSGSVDVSGYPVPYTLDLTVSADGTSMTPRLFINVPGICGGDRTFQPTLTRQ